MPRRLATDFFREPLRPVSLSPPGAPVSGSGLAQQRKGDGGDEEHRHELEHSLACPAPLGFAVVEPLAVDAPGMPLVHAPGAHPEAAERPLSAAPGAAFSVFEVETPPDHRAPPFGDCGRTRFAGPAPPCVYFVEGYHCKYNATSDISE
jgi:hypothetical protein